LSFRQLLDANIAKSLSILELTSIEAIKKCVIKGLGLTILPKNSVQKELHNNRLVELGWSNDLETSVLMVWHWVFDGLLKIPHNLKDKGSSLRLPPDISLAGS